MRILITKPIINIATNISATIPMPATPPTITQIATPNNIAANTATNTANVINISTSFFIKGDVFFAKIKEDLMSSTAEVKDIS